MREPPRAVQSIIRDNLQAYLVGTAGPDIAYTTHYVRLGAAGKLGIDVFPPGTESHGDDPLATPRTGQLIERMFMLAEKYDNDRWRAFALGWLTHYCVDNVIHPLVNLQGGYYVTNAARHKMLEMMECEHAFRKAPPDSLRLYSLNLGSRKGAEYENVPAWFVNEAFRATFSDTPNSPAYEPAGPTAPSAFADHFRRNAENVRDASVAMLATHSSQWSPWWGDQILAVALAGPPPTPQEYELLMEPVRVTSISLRDETDKGEWEKGRKGTLDLVLRVHDVRFLQVFCQEWDRAIETAIGECVKGMTLWSGNPRGFRPPDTNLNTGIRPFNPAAYLPGQPRLNWFRIGIDMSDSRGRPATLLRPEGGPWESSTAWIPCPIGADTGIPSYDPIGTRERRLWMKNAVRAAPPQSLWRGEAGDFKLSVSYDAENPGPYPTGLVVEALDFRRQGWPIVFRIADRGELVCSGAGPASEGSGKRETIRGILLRQTGSVLEGWDSGAGIPGQLVIEVFPDGNVSGNVVMEQELESGRFRIEGTFEGKIKIYEGEADPVSVEAFGTHRYVWKEKPGPGRPGKPDVVIPGRFSVSGEKKKSGWSGSLHFAPQNNDIPFARVSAVWREDSR